MLGTFIRAVAACAGMGGALLASNKLLENVLDMTSKWNQGVVAIVGIGVGFVVYMILARLLRMEEEIQVREIIRRRIKGKPEKTQVREEHNAKKY